MAQGHSGKVRAFLLAFLMATISMSASLPSWEFSTLEEKSVFHTYSTNSTVDLVLGRTNTIPTNLVGNTSAGTFETDSETDSLRFTSSPIESIGKFDLTSGYTGFTCGIFSDIALKCWGYNSYGQLGIGSTTNQNTPQTVNLGTGRTAVSVSIGQYHSCAIVDDGSLKCWGRNYYGELGIGGTTGSSTKYTTPQTVNLGTGRTAVSVSSGQYHTCAILDDGSLKCWGQGTSGQLGIGSTTNQNTPQLVNLGTGRTAVSISVGIEHTCAILDNGNLNCWGAGYPYRLGNNQYSTNHNTPQLVNLGTGPTAVSVSAGYYHTFAVLDDGSLQCWGGNNFGQLGLKSTSNKPTPTLLSISQPTPYQFLGVPDNNSWFGIPNEVGFFNLDVWYNTSSSSTFHRIRANVTAPITYPASVNALTINQSFSIVPSDISCDLCKFLILIIINQSCH